jgi:hypothetical protein
MVELMYLTAKNLTKIDLKYVELIIAFTFTASSNSESLAMTDGEKAINPQGMKFPFVFLLALTQCLRVPPRKFKKTILRLLGSGLFLSFL